MKPLCILNKFPKFRRSSPIQSGENQVWRPPFFDCLQTWFSPDWVELELRNLGNLFRMHKGFIWAKVRKGAVFLFQGLKVVLWTQYIGTLCDHRCHYACAILMHCAPGVWLRKLVELQQQQNTADPTKSLLVYGNRYWCGVHTYAACSSLGCILCKTVYVTLPNSLQ